uniref:Uncharacterized protein n=1 Tax=Rhizophora mucronata TaxID=61149 RepID=A0A2P2QY14_RHIMU
MTLWPPPPEHQKGPFPRSHSRQREENCVDREVRPTNTIAENRTKIPATIPILGIDD